MTKLETRYPCPVCLGVKMEKVTLLPTAPQDAAGPRPPPHHALNATAQDPASRSVSPRGASSRPASKRHTSERGARREPREPQELTLDHCPRCGGVWFEAGEVQRLRRTDATLLWREIVQRDEVHAMQCHSCRTHIERTEPECRACGWKVELDCPACDRPMRIAEQNGMRLDYCTHCKGVWFDHDELTSIWKMEVDALVKRRGSRTLDAAGGIGDVMLLDVLLYDPFVMYYGIYAAGHVAGAAADVVASSGSVEVIGEVAGAAGDVASGLFETIVEIIGGIFG